MAKGIETPNEYLGKADAFVIGELGAEERNIEVVDRVVTGSEMEIDAFMHEKLTIMIHDSNDESDVDTIMVSVNGVRQYFQRGLPQTVRRFFVERLARAKRTSYEQKLDDRLGESMNTMKPHHSLKYPFSVVEDTAKGAAWLRNLLAERT